MIRNSNGTFMKSDSPASRMGQMFTEMNEKYAKMERELAKIGNLEKDLAAVGKKVDELAKENTALKEEMERKVEKFEKQIATLEGQNRLLAWQITNAQQDEQSGLDTFEFEDGQDHHLEMQMVSSSHQQQSLDQIVMQNDGISAFPVKLEYENVGAQINVNDAIEQQQEGQIIENGQNVEGNDGSHLMEMESNNLAQQLFSFFAKFGQQNFDEEMNQQFQLANTPAIFNSNNISNNVKRSSKGYAQKSAAEKERPQQNVPPEKRYKEYKKCGWPGCEFNTKSCDKMKAHRYQNHKGTKTCPKCGQAFQRLADLYRHFRVHDFERPFVCAECNKSFFTLAALEDHQRGMHNGEKPYACTFCGQAFMQMTTLKKHQRRFDHQN